MHTKLVKVSLSSLALLALALTGGPAVVRADKAPESGQDVGVQDTYDLLGNGTGCISSYKYASGAVSDVKAAADIQVPSGPWFLVTQVTVPGTLSISPGISLQNATVEFYQHDTVNNRPGSRFAGPYALTTGLNNGTSVLNIPTTALPPNKTYWFSVQANFSNYAPGGALWCWGTRTLGGTHLGAYLIPTSSGCTVWNVPWDAIGCGNSTVPSEKDLQFSFTYTPFTPTAFIYLPLVSRN